MADMKSSPILRLLTYLMLAYFALVMIGTLPNPADRYFEVGANNYRMLSDTYVHGTHQYRAAVEAALKADGKVTLASYNNLSEIWSRTVKTPYQIPQLDATTVEQERNRLLNLVGAANP